MTTADCIQLGQAALNILLPLILLFVAFLAKSWGDTHIKDPQKREFFDMTVQAVEQKAEAGLIHPDDRKLEAENIVAQKFPSMTATELDTRLESAVHELNLRLQYSKPLTGMLGASAVEELGTEAEKVIDPAVESLAHQAEELATGNPAAPLVTPEAVSAHLQSITAPSANSESSAGAVAVNK